MLLANINRYYWYIGFILFIQLSASVMLNVDFTFVHFISFCTFIIYGIVIDNSSQQVNIFFTKRNLAIIVFSVSVLEVALFQLLSFYIDGDTFVFSKADAIQYYTIGYKMSGMSMIDGFHYMADILGYGFDDWGAFIWISCIFRIIPSQQFLSFSYCIIGTLSSLMLFDIGRNFMPRRYAFIAALSFSLASFMTSFYAQSLKEPIMICIIIASFDCFVTYTRNKKETYLVSALLFVSLVLFFRVPTALLLLFSFGLTWTLLRVKGLTAIVLTILFTVAICATPFFSSSYDRYLKGGDTEAIIKRKNKMAKEGGFVNQMADPIAAIAGPFPSIKIKTIKATPLYASGLLYRLLLSVPFLLGSFFIIKEKYFKMYPLVFFFIMSALGVAISAKGLEVRLTTPHLAVAYIVAFWFIAKCDYGQFSCKISPKLLHIYFASIALLCLIWNLR
ncbi:hypothetical protein [uncultured Bacteroides sp.]|uniref:hypothetical protein n=1 Tax=uncultured Bacteroides sp. TaxID=162156 RepID=UPI002AA7BD95|nr:hypothetical protein [uncultured Bacteroides sp.]